MCDYVSRAFKAWFRSGGIDQPSRASDVYEVEGRRYVVLLNCRGVLAVYRIKPNGSLRRLKRYPKEFDED